MFVTCCRVGSILHQHHHVLVHTRQDMFRNVASMCFRHPEVNNKIVDCALIFDIQASYRKMYINSIFHCSIQSFCCSQCDFSSLRKPAPSSLYHFQQDIHLLWPPEATTKVKRSVGEIMARNFDKKKYNFRTWSNQPLCINYTNPNAWH